LEFTAAVKIQEDLNKETYVSYGALFYAKSIDATEYKGKSYLPHFDDLFYKPKNTDRYRFVQDHEARFVIDHIQMKAQNSRTNQIEAIHLIPFGKTILRQVSF